VTPVSKTLGTYTSGGIVADGSLDGAYEIDPPNAAVASGVPFVVIRIRGVANMLPVLIEYEIDAVNYQDATAFGLSRLDQTVSSRMATYTQPTGFLTAIFPGTVASTTNITAASGITLAAVTHTGATIPTVTTVGVVQELGSQALSEQALDEAVAIKVWEQLTTDTWPNNSFGQHVLIGTTSTRAVLVNGNGHAASVLHDAEPDSIPEDAFVTGALSARVLAADAATEIATAVGTLQVLTRLDSMIESDGAGQFRFDTIALSMAPAGGGGGSTTVNVYPVSASTPERVAGTTLTFYRDESRSVSVVTDFTLTSLTLRFVVEDNDGNDVLVIENAAITKSSQTFTVTITTAVTSNLGNYRWSMRDITTGNSVIAFGVLTVQEAASKDA
jgi:hypothetical protein